MTINLIRALFVAFMAFVGSQVGPVFLQSGWVGTLGGIVFGLVVVLVDRLLRGVSLRLFSSATFGLLMGTFFAHLLRRSEIFRNLSDDAEWVCVLLLYATGAYLGTMLALRSNRQDFSLIIPYVRFRESSVQDAPLLLDGPAIIDGRVAELSGIGFLSTSLVVPRFVLDELRHMAEGTESLRRARGRRALDNLQAMQRNTALHVTIHESQLEEGQTADARLVQLAQVLGTRLLTTDADLCALARLQGVKPLNLRELERVLKPALAQGDQIELALSREGREAHQAVGFLPDGTMIVVNQARAHVGQIVLVRVSSVVQTSSGRLFFAELDHAR